MIDYDSEGIEGFLKIGDAWATNEMYCGDVLVVKDNVIGRLIQRFFRFLARHAYAIAVYDCETLGLAPGERFPVYSLTYWWGLPWRVANRFARRVEDRDWHRLL